jgi:hypothetical protein
MSALRVQLVRGRLRPGTAADRDGGGTEFAAGAVQGVDGLETYFARYLPQVVLAVMVPVAVLAWTAVVDLESAVIMLVTLPVISVFMALIGRSAGARSRANWRALVRLEAHFLDVVRGLPTLRAFNRGTAQLNRIGEVTDRYRRTTMSSPHRPAAGPSRIPSRRSPRRRSAPPAPAETPPRHWRTCCLLCVSLSVVHERPVPPPIAAHAEPGRASCRWGDVSPRGRRQPRRCSRPEARSEQ